MRPYIHINCAMSLDGKISYPSGKSLAISDEEDMARVHELRNSYDGIIVGANTVINDDPSLKVKDKYVKRVNHPARIVLDNTGRIPLTARIFDGTVRTILVTSGKNNHTYSRIEVIYAGIDKIYLETAMNELVNKGIKKLLVEGGGDVIWSFVSSGMFDVITVFMANIIIGGKNTPTMAGGPGIISESDIVKLNLKEVSVKKNGILLTYEPKQ
ncbi:MAG: 2,5-diamino-6-(ribosylamino)-4(3H)-pyrimidinone 5'-phosphate reductase [Candidatus Thermoplasmatota archaeon]|nr:2,5-diamino-6-(ribosylamino)-4(3H)-pyrimidinone 5'-phosphate reductase [Candidatus Thermoplasmatota archaeon]